MPTESISASNAVSINRPRVSFCSRLRAAFFADEPLAGNLDCRVFARGADVFAGRQRLLSEPLALRRTHTFDGWLVVEGSKIARDRAGGELFGEKTQAQGVHDAPLIDSRHGI